MNNLSEVEIRLKDASASLESARRAFSAADYRVVVQNAPLCLELSAKAIIAYFEEPVWRHNPSRQLQRILKERQEINRRLGEEFCKEAQWLAQETAEVAPWHGWSAYRREAENGTWIPSVDLCTAEVARELLQQAERGLGIARTFFDSVSN